MQNPKKWTREGIADHLGLDPALRQHELISTLLTLLETSPLLASCETFPKLSVTVPRKRDDYKCGNCGLRKRNHVCTGEVPVDQTEEPVFKACFKPLTVLLLDSYGPVVQGHLQRIKALGEDKVPIELKIATAASEAGEQIAIFVEAKGLGANQENVYIGQISETFKDLVKNAIEDRTFVKAELAELKLAINPNNEPCLFPQLNIYRNASWRTKRLSEVELMTFGKKRRDVIKSEHPEVLDEHDQSEDDESDEEEDDEEEVVENPHLQQQQQLFPPRQLQQSALGAPQLQQQVILSQLPHLTALHQTPQNLSALVQLQMQQAMPPPTSLPSSQQPSPQLALQLQHALAAQHPQLALYMLGLAESGQSPAGSVPLTSMETENIHTGSSSNTTTTLTNFGQ